jgi:hypothetical protein
MGIVFPSAAVARRWSGALQARMRRAPLEAFLSTRDIAPARPGVARDTDDVARATVLLVEAALALSEAERPDRRPDEEEVGHLACIVSVSLAEAIGQPACWRIAALLSAATLLCPAAGLHSAALASSACVRRFQKSRQAGSPLDQRVAQAAFDAITLNTVTAMAEVTSAIAATLERSTATLEPCSAVPRCR